MLYNVWASSSSSSSTTHMDRDLRRRPRSRRSQVHTTHFINLCQRAGATSCCCAHTRSLASALWAQLVIRARATESCRATYIICYVHACYRYIMRRSEPCGSCGAPSENSRFKLILFMRRLCGRGSRTERTGTRRTGMRNMRCDSGETDHLWYTLVRVYCRLDNACDDRMANWKGKLSRKMPVIVSILYTKSNGYAMSI